MFVYPDRLFAGWCKGKVYMFQVRVGSTVQHLKPHHRMYTTSFTVDDNHFRNNKLYSGTQKGLANDNSQAKTWQQQLPTLFTEPAIGNWVCEDCHTSQQGDISNFEYHCIPLH